MNLRPHDLIFRTAALTESAWTPGMIRRAVARGELVRIRRGAYCHGSVWRGLDARQQHLLRACAVVVDVAEPLLAGRSAAAVWDIPLLGSWPDEVTLLTRHRAGGKSEPGVRRTSIGSERAPAVVQLGLPVTSPARTVVDIAASEGFVAGVVAADWALASGVSREQLRAALATRDSSLGARTAAAAIEFADPAAETAGESAARAVIFQLGFEVPELQFALRDRQGEMRLDFYWRSCRMAGEFDGKVKYTRHEYTGGDPSAVVWREKLREDRVRALTDGVIRILWSHVVNPPQLAAILSAAGVPRRRTGARAGDISGAVRTVIQRGPGAGVGRVGG